MDEVTKSWRKLENEELHKLDFPPSVIRLIRTKVETRRNITSEGQREEIHKYFL